MVYRFTLKLTAQLSRWLNVRIAYSRKLWSFTLHFTVVYLILMHWFWQTCICEHSFYSLGTRQDDAGWMAYSVDPDLTALKKLLGQFLHWLLQQVYVFFLFYFTIWLLRRTDYFNQGRTLLTEGMFFCLFIFVKLFNYLSSISTANSQYDETDVLKNPRV